MICAQCGPPDKVGRETLFFHALAANRREANACGINAFSLWETGYFQSRHTIMPTPILLQNPRFSQSSGRPAFAWDGTPTVILSNREQGALLRPLLGDKVNQVKWASYSFQKREDFTLYVLSERAVRPEGTICRDVNGTLLSKPMPLLVTKTEPERTVEPSFLQSAFEWICTLSFLASVLLNIYLGLAYYTLKRNMPDTPAAVSALPEKEAKTDSPPPAPTSNASVSEKEQVLRKRLNEFRGTDAEFVSLTKECQRCVTGKRNPDYWPSQNPLQDDIFRAAMSLLERRVQDTKDVYAKKTEMEKCWDAINNCLPSGNESLQEIEQLEKTIANAINQHEDDLLQQIKNALRQESRVERIYPTLQNFLKNPFRANPEKSEEAENIAKNRVRDMLKQLCGVEDTFLPSICQTLKDYPDEYGGRFAKRFLEWEKTPPKITGIFITECYLEEKGSKIPKMPSEQPYFDERRQCYTCQITWQESSKSIFEGQSKNHSIRIEFNQPSPRPDSDFFIRWSDEDKNEGSARSRNGEVEISHWPSSTNICFKYKVQKENKRPIDVFQEVYR